MRISDWSSDVCSYDLDAVARLHAGEDRRCRRRGIRDLAIMRVGFDERRISQAVHRRDIGLSVQALPLPLMDARRRQRADAHPVPDENDDVARLALDRPRSEGDTSELQSLIRIPYALFC